MIQLRPAKESDLEWLFDELREFDKFYGADKKLFGSELYVRSRLIEVMERHVFIISEDVTGDKVTPVGFIAGLIQSHFYNPDVKVLGELFWWVIPSYRHSSAAKMLLEEFVSHGKKFADWITFTLETKSPVNERTFLKRGFQLQEKTYLMEVA